MAKMRKKPLVATLSALACSLGVALVLGWTNTGEEGELQCVVCYGRMEVSCRFAWCDYSEVSDAKFLHEDHDWKRVGCWREGSSHILYAAPVKVE